LRRRGLVAMPPADAIEALEQAVLGDEGLITVADVDWERFGSLFTSSRPSPLLANIQPRQGTVLEAADEASELGESAEFEELLALGDDERRRALVDLVKTHTASVLGHAGDGGIQADRAFNEIGFDSLASIQLRDRLSRASGVSLPATMIFDHPTPDALAAFIDEQLTPQESSRPVSVLAELDRLETVLGRPGLGEDVDAIGARLEALAALCRRGASNGASDTASHLLEEASADQLLAFIDEEFGTS
ncbi:phosphopantetheine-binding protein, partial [Streptomyces sp. NPDC047315]|uniref:phosphopantetheine-binding protein n=1 Tax=Streptomyces sp. NPDC047315 TaxID=3155142 RepID=UPI0033C9A3C9